MSRPLSWGDGLHGYDTFSAKGIRFQWREGGAEKEGYVNWKAIERELGALIMMGVWSLVRIFTGQSHIPISRNQKGSLFMAPFLCVRTSQRIDLIQFPLNFPVKFCFPYILLFTILCLLYAFL